MKYRVKCIKKFENKNSNDLRKHFCIPEGEIVDFDIEITQDKKAYIIYYTAMEMPTMVAVDLFNKHFSFNINYKSNNNPPYVRVYFYPNGDTKLTVKSVEGWLENDYPSNLVILTKDGYLCKFKFNNIEQMYPVKEPSDVNYEKVHKGWNRR